MVPARTCPILADNLPGVFAEWGCLHRLHEEGIEDWAAAEIWEDESLTTMSEKVNVCKFLSPLKRAAASVKCWYRPRWIFQTVAVHLGLESTKKRVELFADIKDKPAVGGLPLAGDKDGYKASVKAAEKESSKVKGAIENNLHLTAVMYANLANLYIQRTLVHVCRSVIEWHSYQNKLLRTLADTIKFEIEMLSGGVDKMLLETFRGFLQCDTYESMGIVSVVPVGYFEQFDADSLQGELITQDTRASFLWRCCKELTSRVFIRFLSWTSCWPRRFVLLLADDPTRDATWATFQRHYTIFSLLKAMPMEWAKHLVARSVFLLAPVQQIVLLAEKALWACAGEILAIVRKRSIRFLASQLTEDGAQKCKRKAEVSKHNMLSAATIWGELVDRKVLSEQHSFNEISRRGEPSTRRPALPSDIFRSSLTHPNKHVDLKGITSKVDYVSPGAKDLPLPACDLRLTELLHEKDNILDG